MEQFIFYQRSDLRVVDNQRISVLSGLKDSEIMQSSLPYRKIKQLLNINPR